MHDWMFQRVNVVGTGRRVEDKKKQNMKSRMLEVKDLEGEA